jgi:hypothetical protein
MALTYPHDDLERGRRTLTLVLSNYPRKPRRRIQLTFVGISDLSISQDEDSVRYLHDLAIGDIRSKGWEALNYEVRETEEGALRFYCADFDALDLNVE